MKTLSVAALLTPFFLLATLIGAVVTQAHRNAATPPSPTVAIVCGQYQPCSAPVAPITTLPTIRVYADMAYTGNPGDTRSALTRWLNALQPSSTADAPLTMPYYSFSTSRAVTAKKG